jgi:hypothetical protein
MTCSLLSAASHAQRTAKARHSRRCQSWCSGSSRAAGTLRPQSAQTSRKNSVARGTHPRWAAGGGHQGSTFAALRWAKPRFTQAGTNDRTQHDASQVLLMLAVCLRPLPCVQVLCLVDSNSKQPEARFKSASRYTRVTYLRCSLSKLECSTHPETYSGPGVCLCTVCRTLLPRLDCLQPASALPHAHVTSRVHLTSQHAERHPLRCLTARLCMQCAQQHAEEVCRPHVLLT